MCGNERVNTNIHSDCAEMGMDAIAAAEILIRTDCIDVLLEQLHIVNRFFSDRPTPMKDIQLRASYGDQDRDANALVEDIAENVAAALMNVCIDENIRLHLLRQDGAVETMLRGCSILHERSMSSGTNAARYNEITHDLLLSLAGMALDGELHLLIGPQYVDVLILIIFIPEQGCDIIENNGGLKVCYQFIMGCSPDDKGQKTVLEASLTLLYNMAIHNGKTL